MADSFLTLAGAHRAETREKGSRFIATALPARDQREARAAIEMVREEFPDATHHVWAYSIETARGGPEERCHDAGEPGGTAGPPVLQAIRTKGLRNLVVVVSRYFGGTKLGKGGLARAYRGAAALALREAPTVATVREILVEITLPLSLDGEARHLVARHGGRVESFSYDDPETSVLRARVPAAERVRLQGDLQALARGEARVRESDDTI